MRDFLNQNRWQLLTLVILTFAVYLNGLNSAFVSDDIAVIVTNPYIGQIKGYVFTSLGFGRSLYMTTLYHLAGQTPWIYRFFNILLHLSVVLLMYQFLTEITKKSIAFTTALLFAIHPLTVESVTWISGGAYPQYAFPTLFSFYFFRQSLNHNYWKNTIIAMFLFFIALASGEKAIVLPGLLILYLILQKNLKSHLKLTLPYFLLSGIWAFLLINKIEERLASVATSPSPPGSYNFFLQIPIAIVSYLKLIFWPDKLTLYQSELKFSWHQFYYFAAITIIFGAILIISYLKARKIFWGLAWFLIVLSPTLTPLGVSWVVAERYAYLALPGIIFATVYLADKITRRLPREITLTLFIIIATGLSLRTIKRNQDWKNEDTLWTATVAISKSSPNAHNNMGDVYTRHGQLELAAAEFAKAIELQPSYAEAYHNLGNALFQMGQKEKAVEVYLKAIEIKPQLWQAHQNVATIFYDLGKKQEAIQHLKTAQQLNPTNSALHTNLGSIYLFMGEVDKAVEQYQQALKINPQDTKAQAGILKITSNKSQAPNNNKETDK